MYICTCIYMYMYKYNVLYMYMYTCKYNVLYMYMYISMFVYIYMYMYTGIFLVTIDIHVHVCIFSWQALNYSEEMLGQREVVHVDIATELPSNGEYKPEQVLDLQYICIHVHVVCWLTIQEVLTCTWLM